MRVRILFISIITLSIYQLSYSQLENKIWYFGSFAGLDFSTSPPTPLFNSAMNSPSGCASICDTGGNLLFYCRGDGIWNNTHSTMANGTGLLGGLSSTQSSMIVKQPSSNNIYYVFTLSQGGGSAGLRYSIVDMTLAAGLGSVTVKNATLFTPSCEKQFAVRHCNGNDIWIVSHDYGSNQFRSYLLTSNGLNPTPVLSAIGESIAGSVSATFGNMKVSPDGKKLAIANNSNSVPSTLGLGGFHLFDFDAATGVVSNSLTLKNVLNAYGVEFSPDGTKLYGVVTASLAAIPATLLQWNICGTSTAIVASQYSVNLGFIGAGSLQNAIDGKMYMATSSSQSISVINNPNASGSAMNLVLNAISLSPKICGLGLPNYINSYTRPAPAPFTQTIACQTAYFSVPPVPTFSSGCSSTPYAPSSYQWDFGDGSAVSTVSNAAHTFSSTGTYTVKLILYGACTNDTLKQIVTLTTPGPNPQVAGPLSICKGDRVTYTVSGGTTYNWFNNATTSTIAISPSLSTVYTVSATTNGCTLSKSFSVTVNPCTAIGENNPALQDIVLYPNPVNALLTIETKLGGELSIVDINGKMVLQQTISSGKHEINTETLKAGVYFIQLGKGDDIRRMKLLKLE